MSDLGDDEFEADEAMRADIIRRARTEGVRTAYESALAVCRDPNAPAAAKASSQRTLLMVGGLLDRNDRNAGAAKPASEMDGNELQQAIERASRKRKRHLDAAAKPTGGAFD
ncbi:MULTISPECIES: hypothetical protein [unclassified Mesorhizobium]|uniref:hypothetical protein n=1 Tax=unclassified Mesorhizobium TaxID=325217 RepID=UPI000FCAA846|nr:MULTISPECIES: hypothetical protein [unclassified Mesorhizobium]RUV39982.1 hypothetical protein EOD29_30375 [Mesorhizobium sp. M1A.T.Ca.IN.004.03.1.1]RWK28554.1 MAG: hypothetical protein EOR40_28395 [Mesorhizobium sp.]RWK84303.1 MAG: hypothetical protein EOR52_29250 [Mesorhizobium sp.]TIP15300.1 MAG: hypothetical protein E5X66_30545 [Mesorhizobium sp.]TJV77861.1 MAG: hypothetical protein E5X45_26340 [Mesorhizobium sp.]